MGVLLLLPPPLRAAELGRPSSDVSEATPPAAPAAAAKALSGPAGGVPGPAVDAAAAPNAVPTAADVLLRLGCAAGKVS
jgi:hypothetical protein